MALRTRGFGRGGGGGGGGAPAFSPAVLFAAGEVGTWYDPSDLTTLFTDTAGTTPVTTPGQTVALMLDKSRGLVLGPQLAPQDTSTLTGWTVSATAPATVTGTGQGLRLQSPAGEFCAVGITVPSGGARYSITYTVQLVSGQLEFRAIPNEIFTIAGTYTRTVIVQSESLGVNIRWARTGSSTDAYIRNISVRELPGNHATQATTLSRPTYRVDGGGRPYLEFDGSDDFMLTGTITPGVDKAQVFAGVRKLSDAAAGMVAEMSTSNSNSGMFLLLAPSAAATNYQYRSRGTSEGSATYTNAAVAAPVTNVVSGIGDISGDNATLRINNTQVAQSTADQGTGNYLAYPLYIGRRGGTSLPFSGNLYGLITRFSAANLDAATIGSTETWLNSRTGAY